MEMQNVSKGNSFYLISEIQNHWIEMPILLYINEYQMKILWKGFKHNLLYLLMENESVSLDIEANSFFI